MSFKPHPININHSSSFTKEYTDCISCQVNIKVGFCYSLLCDLGKGLFQQNSWFPQGS